MCFQIKENWKKKKKFYITNLCLYYRYLYGLIKEKKAEGLMFDFWVFNETIHMRELQESRVINITQEFDIWYFFNTFSWETEFTRLEKRVAIYRRVMICDFL